MRSTTQSGSMRSWLDWKEDGKEAYERGDYQHSLESYRQALKPEYECPTKADQAVLWSNIVACRLQLVDKSDGTKDLAQARAAVEDAKHCVRLNPNWAKGHLRLASAYIALGDHSNSVCNELQSALRIDPGNSSARQLLMRELRRDQATSFTANSNGSERDPPTNPNYRPSSSASSAQQSTTSQQSSFASASASNSARTTNDAVDDGLTWRERLHFQMTRVSEWYYSLNSDVKTGLKFAFLLLVMYLAFGGRFGLQTQQRQLPPRSYDTATTRGNYGSDNAYDRFQREHRQERHSSIYYSDGAYDRTYNDAGHETYYAPPRRSNSGNRGFSVSNLFDGSLQSMAILAGVAYVCHRNGINPFQAIMMLNLIGGGGRRRMHGFGGGYGRRRGFRW